MKFDADISYYMKITEELKRIYEPQIDSGKILGVGISLPGIINQKEKLLVKSHALNLENYSLKMIELGKKIFKYNLFDDDLSYLKNCSYRKEASAVRVAKQFFWKVMETI